MYFKEINLSNPLWDNYVSSSYSFDFHHTSCFHKIEYQHSEIPVLLVFYSHNEHICFPLIIKPIPNTDLFDATSVYGYCGPIASKSSEELSEELINFFRNKMIDYCHQNKIVSVFSRLHSLIPQRDFFQNFGKILDLNKTVAIDLTLPIDEQRRAFRKSNKSEINQLKGKKCYVFQQVDTTDNESIREFVKIYHETMERVKATSYYYFDFDYFKQLLNNPCFECDLLIAKKDNDIAAGAIFTRTNSIMQYHLAGTKDKYKQDTPMKLILDEARKIGTVKGLKYLHLGGGVGGSDSDSLFHFKSGFSKNFYQFSVWNLIVNSKIYNKLVKQNSIGDKTDSNFFPLYRAGK